MTHNLLLKCIFALSVFGVTLIAGLIPFKIRKTIEHPIEFPIGETLATGVFLGAGLLHMLPEATRIFTSQGYHYPFAALITGIVFLLFLWFEHVGKELYHHHNAVHPAFALLAWVMLCIHSLILGTALGMNHQQSLMIMLFFAIIAHKWAESFAISMQLNKSRLSFYSALIFFILFTLMTPLGIFIGTTLTDGISPNPLMEASLIAASAGTFLYLGTLHGLERCVLVERCCNLRYFSFVIVGFILMGGVAFYV